MTVYSPSRFIVHCTNQSLLGTATAKEDGYCALCGGPIFAGERVTPTSTLGESFNSKHDINGSGSDLICGCCKRVSSRDWMERLKKSLVTEQGVFVLASNAAQAQMILNPPPPPFLAYVATGQMQHVIWRSRVTVSHDEIFVRVGDTQLSFSSARVHKLLVSARALVELMRAHGLNGKSPFQNSDRELKGPTGTALRPDLMRAIETDSAAMAHAAALGAMSLGECWAVGIAVTVDPALIKSDALVAVTP